MMGYRKNVAGDTGRSNAVRQSAARRTLAYPSAGGDRPAWGKLGTRFPGIPPAPPFPSNLLPYGLFAS